MRILFGQGKEGTWTGECRSRIGTVFLRPLNPYNSKLIVVQAPDTRKSKAIERIARLDWDNN